MDAITATPNEPRRLVLTMLDAVYVDAREKRRVVAIRAKPPFHPLLEWHRAFRSRRALVP